MSQFGMYPSIYKYKTYEEAMLALESRKNENIKNLDTITNYSSLIIKGSTKCLVLYGEDGEIKSCLCTKCLNKINRSPVYNGAYVYPLCIDCLSDVEHIENIQKKDAKMKTNSKKNDIAKINFDWVAFEKMIVDGTAKLVKLSEEHNVYPTQLKEAIISKYGSQISFKKGRNGGIMWTVKAVG
jgi:hypothetical protein